ncbi:MAG: EamA family transporter, partial [Desulfobacteraceae bacterium]|nr:EamA family transporter [Desulfobacteraceae bacterium]
MIPKKANHLLYGYGFALGATALWSGNFIVARGLTEAIPPVSLAFFRWLTAVLVFAPFAVKGFAREWPLLRQHLMYMAVTAFLGVTCFNTFIYVAGHTTTAMNLSLIAITFPVFVVVFSRIFFKEVLTGKKLAGIVVVLIGVICLITRGDIAVLLGISFVAGDLWMLAAAVIFAVFSILLKHKPDNISVYSFQFTLFCMGLIFLLPMFI